MSVLRVLLFAVLCLAVTVESKPFFDSIYDAIHSNARRSYGYSGDGNYGYEQPNYGHKSRNVHAELAARQGKSYKDICRVHFPGSVSSPGAGGIVCPY
ncbi:hypothetical protein PYW08_003646 [Mythimna loreyi]|uniref:Uncharacterized protein n=1 Tax=Mythimna loreyi TaxID=667449 RepID=A0ACC2QT68_9NEOP|nr:hypothetical protein PYW08_003646 [Mythimna loreyi]